MSTRRALAQQLGVVAGFDDPHVALEQYRTPPEIASHIVHVADVHGDLVDRTVVDLGTGTGMLALGAALRGPRRVIGIELDREALQTARANERRVGSTAEVSWVHADATQVPLCVTDATVLMNPPFGAQRDNVHADRRFLHAASEFASVSYSVHNAGSRSFVESFAVDEGGAVTHGFRATIDLERQFDFHDDESRSIDAEVYRIEWNGQ